MRLERKEGLSARIQAFCYLFDSFKRRCVDPPLYQAEEVHRNANHFGELFLRKFSRGPNGL